MSELETFQYCPKCDETTHHIFSGSGRKGTCMKCGRNLPEEQRANLSHVVSYNG
jgi:uncharacterized paraquat-inducible protein A